MSTLGLMFGKIFQFVWMCGRGWWCWHWWGKFVQVLFDEMVFHWKDDAKQPNGQFYGLSFFGRFVSSIHHRLGVRVCVHVDILCKWVTAGTEWTLEGSICDHHSALPPPSSPPPPSFMIFFLFYHHHFHPYVDPWSIIRSNFGSSFMPVRHSCCRFRPLFIRCIFSLSLASQELLNCTSSLVFDRTQLDIAESSGLKFIISLLSVVR